MRVLRSMMLTALATLTMAAHERRNRLECPACRCMGTMTISWAKAIVAEADEKIRNGAPFDLDPLEDAAIIILRHWSWHPHEGIGENQNQNCPMCRGKGYIPYRWWEKITLYSSAKSAKKTKDASKTCGSNYDNKLKKLEDELAALEEELNEKTAEKEGTAKVRSVPSIQRVERGQASQDTQPRREPSAPTRRIDQAQSQGRHRDDCEVCLEEICKCVIACPTGCAECTQDCVNGCKRKCTEIKNEIANSYCCKDGFCRCLCCNWICGLDRCLFDYNDDTPQNEVCERRCKCLGESICCCLNTAL